MDGAQSGPFADEVKRGGAGGGCAPKLLECTVLAVMPGLVPGIHDLNTAEWKEFVDARDEPGHDGQRDRSDRNSIQAPQDPHPSHPPNTAFSSAMKARARCDRPAPLGGRPCFSSAVISPKVRAWPSGWNIGS